jgi:hypothetical protein
VDDFGDFRGAEDGAGVKNDRMSLFCHKAKNKGQFSCVVFVAEWYYFEGGLRRDIMLKPGNINMRLFIKHLLTFISTSQNLQTHFSQRTFTSTASSPTIKPHPEAANTVSSLFGR